MHLLLIIEFSNRWQKCGVRRDMPRKCSTPNIFGSPPPFTIYVKCKESKKSWPEWKQGALSWATHNFSSSSLPAPILCEEPQWRGREGGRGLENSCKCCNIWVLVCYLLLEILTRCRKIRSKLRSMYRKGKDKLEVRNFQSTEYSCKKMGDKQYFSRGSWGIEQRQ